MNHYSGKFYEVVQKDLMDWVWNNEKLRNKISPHDLKYLFEFDPKRGLSIDLRRFELEYYQEVFYPPEVKKAHIDEFVRKVCFIIGQSVKHAGKADLSITITVRHMVSEVSHWKTFFIDQGNGGKSLSPMTMKEQDWHYSFRK